MPGFIKPQLATLKPKAPKGEQWLHEIKFDGYRIQIHINSGRKKVFTRNGLDWTKRFSAIAGALDIRGQAIIDGEVVVTHEGRTNFSELQAELAAGRQDRLVYYAFDLLWRDGDLRGLPQIERKQALLDLLGENDVELPVLYSKHLTGDGQQMFEHAAKLNWEGIISKRADASLPTLNTVTSRRRACCEPVRLRGCLGNRLSEQAVRPFVRLCFLHWTQLVTPMHFNSVRPL
jgi:bifunctional non-homologous end joining protein LigD